MIKRVFVPVGQGAFYYECLEVQGEQETIKVVYDCGSSTDEELLEKRINEEFKEGEKIDALIISHLDEDHINGIPHLLARCHVKKIYMPLITCAKDLNKISMQIKGADKFTIDFIDNPERALGNDGPKVMYIKEYVSSYHGKVESRDIGIENEYIDRNNLIESGYNIMEDINDNMVATSNRANLNWEYIPYNFRQSERIKNLKEALNDEFGKFIDINTLGVMWENGSKDEKDKIKKAYKKVPGTLNTNSMTLFSGINVMNENREPLMKVNRVAGKTCNCSNWSNGVYCCTHCWNKFCGILPGCLYMGDYDASGPKKWETLRDAYEEYWKSIGCVQVPHHGSKHNFNEQLLNNNWEYIISVGKKNRYRHPHAKVIREFMLKNIMPYIITEESQKLIMWLK